MCIRDRSYYPELFKKAFGNQEINSDKISKALSQFIRSIVSYSSKYDEGRAVSFDQKVPFQNFTNEENLGCLLYTSDAADERSSVDLGGRRIIKKKKNKYKI